MRFEKDSKILRHATNGLHYLQQILDELEDRESLSITELKHLAGHVEYELKGIVKSVDLAPELFYGHVWNILVEHAGASKTLDAQRDFVFHMTDTRRPVTEYRFQGHLGFGGKLWREAGTLKISCYSEDLTEENHAIIDRTNEVLSRLAAV